MRDVAFRYIWRTVDAAPPANALLSATLHTFAWAGLNTSGQRVHGELQARDAHEALLQLRRQGITHTTVRPRRTSAWRHRRRPRAVATFTRQLATLLRTGVPLLRGFEMMAQGADDAQFRTVLQAIHADVQGGRALSSALARHPRHFDAVHCALVAAGEASGTLDLVLERLAQSLEKLLRIRARLRSAMMYPALVLTVAALVLVGILAWVVPTFEQTFASFGATLPWATRMVIAASHALVHYGPWLLIAVVPAALWLRHAWHTHAPFRAAVDRLALRVPMAGPLLRKALVARWTRTLCTMLTAGVNLLEALQSVAAASGNQVWAQATLRMREQIASGASLSAAMRRSGLFEPLTLQLALLGEESGALDELLARAADLHEQEFDESVNGLSSLIEPLTVLWLGALIGAIVVAMYLPVFQLGNLL